VFAEALAQDALRVRRFRGEVFDAEPAAALEFVRTIPSFANSSRGLVGPLLCTIGVVLGRKRGGLRVRHVSVDRVSQQTVSTTAGTDRLNAWPAQTPPL
jgi:hypothetical protein